MRAGPYVRDKLRPEAGYALAAFMADTPIYDSVRAVFKQAASQRLRRLVRMGIMNRAVHGSYVVEIGVEVSEIETHLDTRLQNSYFREFPPAVVCDFRLRSFQFPGGIPCAATRPVETAAIGTGMAIGCHDDTRLRARYPFVFRHAMENRQLGGNPVIGPGFQLENKR